MTSNDTNASLSSLLDSSSFLLAYTVPLIIVSVVITFAGAFLTLDRTRTFAPSAPGTSNPQNTKHNVIPFAVYMFFEGGVGGIATGFAFGVHASTFLSLLIPSVSSSAPLGEKSFTATWLLAGLLCAIVAGRWKYAAFALSGLSGFTTFSLALSIMLHPNLITRIVLTATFTVIGTILCILPLPFQFSHAPLRFATAATGAFGLILCVALMGHIRSWANAWNRYLVSNSADWGTSQEKGLSAAYCIILSLGVLCDWLLHKKLGENPDEKWDRYLADYSTNLPTERDRAGAFQPFSSVWDRILHPGFHPTVNPVDPGEVEANDAKFHPPPDYTPGKLYRYQGLAEKKGQLPDLSAAPPRTAFLRKDRKDYPTPGFISGARKRAEINFNNIHEDVYSSEEEEDVKPLGGGFQALISQEEDITVASTMSVSQGVSIERLSNQETAVLQQEELPKKQSHWNSFWRDVRTAAEADHA